MVYTLIGRAVVKGAKVFLRRRYGPSMTPRPLLAGAVVTVIVGVAVAAAKREGSA